MKNKYFGKKQNLEKLKTQLNLKMASESLVQHNTQVKTEVPRNVFCAPLIK